MCEESIGRVLARAAADFGSRRVGRVVGSLGPRASCGRCAAAAGCWPGPIGVAPVVAQEERPVNMAGYQIRRVVYCRPELAEAFGGKLPDGLSASAVMASLMEAVVEGTIVVERCKLTGRVVPRLAGLPLTNAGRVADDLRRVK